MMKPDEGGRESTRQKVTGRRIPPLAVIVAVTFTAISPKPARTQRVPDPPRPSALLAGVTAWTNSMGMKFVRIAPGRFVMGTPEREPDRMQNEKRHEVRITRAYLLGVHEVTRGQFRAFVNDTGYRTDAEKAGFAIIFTGTEQQRRRGGSWRDVGYEQTDDHPVVSMSWNDAVAFAAWLSRKEGRHYRLPTEAEWEFACRAGTDTAYPWGDNPDDGAGFANAGDQSAKRQFPNMTAFNWDDGFVYTAPVGSFKPNAWGLYDMIGNALEWCSDYYGEYPDGVAVDPKGPAKGDNIGARILRGGSWFNRPQDIRVGFRHWHAADYQMNLIGFRLAMDPS
jgi:formylglycine-generating enzyme required for sulfatase activity